MGDNELALRYGSNPHQVPARVHRDGGLPFRVLNGSPGYINMLDALNSWQLVKELKEALGLPAAASFKHVSPAGAAVGVPLSDSLRRAYFVGNVELSLLAVAYARARGADRLSSFGDWAAMSDIVDVATARLIGREVSDGIIAPGYDEEALTILKAKKDGKYNVIEVDGGFTPSNLESRDIFGVRFEQRRNDLEINDGLLRKAVTVNKAIPDSARRDLIVATLALKYTQSNSVCFAYDGQVIGLGAGQQSRIHCTRLAGEKADHWFLRQHPALLGLKWKKGLGRPERDNAIDLYLQPELTTAEEAYWAEAFAEVPTRLTTIEKRDWLDRLDGVAFSSDAFFPFRDCIDRAQQTGVKYVLEPGGSVRDEDTIGACDDYGMVMLFSGARLFHH